MANKKKRSAGDVKPAAAASVQSEPKAKKKPKFSFTKTLSTDAAVASDAKKNDQSIVKNVAEPAAVDASSAPKKKKNKKNKNKSSAAAAATRTTSAHDADKKETKKDKASEIDDLFASLKTEKRKKSIAEEQQKLAKEEEERREKKEKARLQEQVKKLEAQNTNSTAVGLNPDPRPVRYDEDGLPIYTEASLQIGKGGDTKDCPFDCWCCF